MNRNKLEEYAQLIQESLEDLLIGDVESYETLIDSMRYSTLSGGKRVRPYLCMEFCEMCGGTKEQAIAYGAAAEMIHTFSLVHDDLPAMDNDDYRRGRHTNHKIFGEATAILAGDSLIFKAIETAINAPLSAELNAEAVRVICEKSGAKGVCGGQQIDLEGERRVLSKEEIFLMYELKTCALLSMSCTMGVIAANGTEEQKNAADLFGELFGKAFQIVDDLLDREGDPKLLGKNTGSDEKNAKSNFVKLYGIEKAKEKASEYSEWAKEALDVFEDCDAKYRIIDFCDVMLNRKK